MEKHTYYMPQSEIWLKSYVEVPLPLFMHTDMTYRQFKHSICDYQEHTSSMFPVETAVECFQ